MEEYILKENEEVHTSYEESILYKGEKIKKRASEKSKEKFDLCTAIRDDCSIDESGICTCGAGV